MSKVSAKRQITLPVDQCQILGIRPGDEVEIFIYEGHLTLVKKTPGNACGLLRHVKPKLDVSDEESRQSALT
jgi:AbrB family looped-hinge helix DNA binding protein